MAIQWFSKDLQSVATIYETNITLNTVASNHFKNAYKTIIGFDKKNSAIIIKPITKEEVTMGLYKEKETHRISIKPSYGRINGKSIIRNVCNLHPLNFKDHTYHKFECSWDQEEKMLKIFLEKEVS